MARHALQLGFGTVGPTRASKPTHQPFGTWSKRPPRDVWVTYGPVGPSCDPSCPYLDGACYGLHWRCGKLQRRAAGETFDLAGWLTSKVHYGSLVRHRVTGGAHRDGTLDRSYLRALEQGHSARPDLAGWHYFEAWRNPRLSRWVREQAPDNLACLASCQTPAEVRAARRKGWPSVAVTAEGTPQGKWDRATKRRALALWGPLARELGMRPIACPGGCATCQACLAADTLVVLPDHGPGRKLMAPARAAKGDSR